MFLKLVMPQSIQCHGSEVLQQSRTLVHKSSLTDLHIACELTASRDSGTDASQANAAFTAGSVTKQHGACSRVSPTSGGWISCCNTVGTTMTILVKVTGRVLRTLSGGLMIFCEPSAEEERAPSHGCWSGCACCRTKETSVWVGDGGWERHATVRVGVVDPPRATWFSGKYVEQFIAGCASLHGKCLFLYFGITRTQFVNSFLFKFYRCL